MEPTSDAGTATLDAGAPGHFADRLIRRVRELGHPLCAGIDPHLDLVPPPFRRGGMEPGAPATAEAVEELLLAYLDLVAARVAIVKPQIAFFELLGWRGFRLLETIAAAARARGLLVLLDAKRGDVGSTSEAYARAYLEPGATIDVDAITLNPYLGRETLAPFLERARSHGRGAFVLVKTSNPGSGDYQDRELAGVPFSDPGALLAALAMPHGPPAPPRPPVAPGPLFVHVARSLAEAVDALAGPATGWSSLGVVVGATHPDHAPRVREALPRALFLVPGYGTQGGAAREALSGFVAGPAGREGGIVNSSRGLLFPKTGPSVREWEAGVAAALDAAVCELGEAVSRPA